jgi:hypothetical protein
MIVLRYFAIVGRAQPLRHALADTGVAHEDVRIALTTGPSRERTPRSRDPIAASQR